MRFFKLGSPKLISVSISPYLIKWDKDSCSKLQTRAKKFFKKYWQNYICLEEFTVPGSRMRVDFMNLSKKLAVEVSPAHHNEFNPFFHRNSKAVFYESMKRDAKKLEWLEKNGFTLIELNEKDLDSLSPEFIQENFGVDIY